MNPMQVTTSFGGIDAETGEYIPEGTSEVKALPTSGGRITEDSFHAMYDDHVSGAVVTRNGDNVTINALSDYRDDDLIRISDGGGPGMEMTVASLKAAGLGYMLEEAVNSSVASRRSAGGAPQGGPQEAPLGAQGAQGTSQDAPQDTGDSRSNLEANLQDAVASGELDQRTAANASLFYDTAEMLGVDPDMAAAYAIDALDTGDYSVIEAALGPQGDHGAARNTIEAVYQAVEAEAERAIGRIGMMELEQAATVHPEVRRAILEVGHQVATGQMGRDAFSALLSEIKANYSLGLRYR